MNRFERVAPEIHARLGFIAELLTPDVCLTLVMRHPTDADCYFIISDDTDYEAVAALVRHHADLEASDASC